MICYDWLLNNSQLCIDDNISGKNCCQEREKGSEEIQWFAQQLISPLEAKTKQQLIFIVEACSNKEIVEVVVSEVIDQIRLVLDF